jgi:hypothetical protein
VFDEISEEVRTERRMMLIRSKQLRTIFSKVLLEGSAGAELVLICLGDKGSKTGTSTWWIAASGLRTGDQTRGEITRKKKSMKKSISFERNHRGVDQEI